MKTYIKQISALLFISLIISCSKEEVCYEADLVLVNSKIYTANADQWEAAALAILGDKFIFIGSNDDSSAYACGSNRVLDLKDSFVFPGFIDAHAHLKGIGYREITLNLQGADSLKNMLTLVQIHSNKLSDGDWVVGRGWIEKKWPEGRFPTIEELDAISSKKPIALERADGHAIIVNSLALKLAGIDRSTPDPIGGKIDKDAYGEPNGVLIDKASSLVESIIPKRTREEEKRALREGLNRTAKMGWTQLHDAGSPLSDYEILNELKKNEGLPVRIQFYVSDGEDGNKFLDEGPYLDPDHFLTSRGIKFYADGAIGSRGAAFFDKYDDYETKITSVDFGAMTALTNFNDDGSTANKINLTSATNVDLASLTRHKSTSALPFTIITKKGATIDISAFDDVSTAGAQEDLYMELNGPASITLSNIYDGDIGLTNVATASVSNFIGTLDVNAGVETLTVVDGVNVDMAGSSDLKTATLDFAYDSDTALTAAVTGSKNVIFAIISTSIILLATFAPLLFIGGISGTCLLYTSPSPRD